MIKTKINWKSVLIGIIIGIVIASAGFLSWYYFTIEAPKQRAAEELLIRKELIRSSMIELGYTEEEIEEALDFDY